METISCIIDARVKRLVDVLPPNEIRGILSRTSSLFAFPRYALHRLLRGGRHNSKYRELPDTFRLNLCSRTPCVRDVGRVRKNNSANRIATNIPRNRIRTYSRKCKSQRSIVGVIALALALAWGGLYPRRGITPGLQPTPHTLRFKV